MEATGDGPEDARQEAAEEGEATGLQLDQAEADVDQGPREQMVNDEELHPAYGDRGEDSVEAMPDPDVGERLRVQDPSLRVEETLASVRRPEPPTAVPSGESPESRRSESRQSDEVRLQMGQLTEMLQTLVQSQQTLTNRLERVEEARSSHSWRSAESSQGLGWVDQGALERWYAEVIARAAASGHRDVDMFIAGDVQGFSGWWNSRPDPGLGGCGGSLPPPGFGGPPTQWTFPHPPPALPTFPFPNPPLFPGQAPWQAGPLEAHAASDRGAQGRPETQLAVEHTLQQRLEAQALQDRAMQQRLEAQASHGGAVQGRSEVQASPRSALQGRSEAQASPGSALQSRSEAQASPGSALQDRSEAQASPGGALQGRSEAQAPHGGTLPLRTESRIPH